MTKQQIFNHLLNETPLKISENEFKEWELEGENKFDIERICRCADTVDLWHLDSGEVIYDVVISELETL